MEGKNTKFVQNNIIYGKHAVLLACNNRNPEDITKILLTEKSSIALIPKNLQNKIEIHTLKALNNISHNHNGFICYTKPIRTINERELKNMQNILALDCVQDVGNIGAILRTAAAFNVEAIIYTTDKMPDISQNATVSKLSSGGIELVKLCCVTNLSRTLENLKKENFWIIGTDAKGQEISKIKKQYENSKKVLVLGNEETGIRPNIWKICDAFASIKINQQIESLNVSVAGGIIMWELFGEK